MLLGWDSTHVGTDKVFRARASGRLLGTYLYEVRARDVIDGMGMVESEEEVRCVASFSLVCTVRR